MHMCVLHFLVDHNVSSACAAHNARSDAFMVQWDLNSL